MGQVNLFPLEHFSMLNWIILQKNLFTEIKWKSED